MAETPAEPVKVRRVVGTYQVELVLEPADERDRELLTRILESVKVRVANLPVEQIRYVVK